MATTGIFGSGSGYGGFSSANQVRDNPYEDPLSQYNRMKDELIRQQQMAMAAKPSDYLMQDLQRAEAIEAEAAATSRLLKRKRKLLLLENV